jgi:zinc finger HIT domain-containing protein 3
MESDENRDRNRNLLSLEALCTSKELGNIFTQYTSLHGKLRDIYRATLEEEWIESRTSDSWGLNGKKAGYYRSGERRGPWTAEKGFNRGMQMAKRWREDCEEGLIPGPEAEGFLKFVNLVISEQEMSAS